MWKKYINGLGDIFVLHMDKNTIAHTKSSEHYTHGRRGDPLLFLDVSGGKERLLKSDDFLLRSLLGLAFVQTPFLSVEFITTVTHIYILGMGFSSHFASGCSSDFLTKIVKLILWWWSSLGQFSSPGRSGLTWRHFVSRPFVMYVHMIQWVQTVFWPPEIDERQRRGQSGEIFHL